MYSITRHMTIQIAQTTLFATCVLCLAVVLVQSIRFIDLIVSRGLPITDFGYLALLITPRFLAVVLLIAVFGATLFTYSRMISGSELVVLRSAGMSSLRLATPGLIVGAGVTLICYTLTLYVTPVAAHELRSYLNKARSELSAILIKEGQFTVVDDTTTVYARARAPNGDLLGLIVHSEAEPGRMITVVAERGAVVDAEYGARLLLSNGNQQTFENGEFHLLNFDEYTFELVERHEDPAYRWVEPSERFLTDLFMPGDSRDDVYYRSELIAEGHNRLAQPIQAVAFVLIAMAVMLNAVHDRRGQTLHIILAVAVVVTLVVFYLTLASGTSRRLSLAPLLYLNSIVPIVVALAVLARPPRLVRRQRPAAA